MVQNQGVESQEGGNRDRELVQVSKRGLGDPRGDGPVEQGTADGDDQIQVGGLRFNEPPGKKGADEKKRRNSRPWGP